MAIDDLDALEVGQEAARHGVHFGRRRGRLAGRLGEEHLPRLGGFTGLRKSPHPLRAEGEHDVLGGHLLAVVELDTLPQLELDRLVVDARPALGESGLLRQITLAIHLDERIEDARKDARADIGLLAQRIENARIDDLLYRDGDNRAVIGARRRRNRA